MIFSTPAVFKSEAKMWLKVSHVVETLLIAFTTIVLAINFY